MGKDTRAHTPLAVIWYAFKKLDSHLVLVVIHLRILLLLKVSSRTGFRWEISHYKN